MTAGPTQGTPHTSDDKEVSLIRLGSWSFYFIAKLILFQQELIGFHGLENLAFAFFLLMPVSAAPWRHARTAIAIPVALGLLYYDSWLPPLERVWSQAALLSNFSSAYLWDLATRFISWPVIAALVLSWAVFRIATRFVRVGALIVLALLVTTWSNGSQRTAQPDMSNASSASNVSSGGHADPDAILAQFYAKEAKRSVKFPRADNETPFDIIFIHVCSLSWDDLAAVGLDKHSLWSNADFVFRRFNSATSYSGPAAIRINRANCGQASHQGIFDPVSDECLLMPSLKQSGFETNLALNHDGHFDDFLSMVRKQGVNVPLMPLTDVSAPLRAFDGSPVYDDLSVLSRWFETRRKSSAPRVALYYNTISLHDGNRIVSGPNAGLAIKDNYRPRAEKLLSDITAFIGEIRKSGRRAIVAVVPEHGAALRGDKFQIAGLREIPTPSITLVPVSVNIVGPEIKRNGSGVQVTEPMSYLGLSQLISRLIGRPPYGEAGFDPAEYVAELPGTDYVAETEGAIVLAQGNRYMLKQGKEAWRPFPVAGNPY